MIRFRQQLEQEKGKEKAVKDSLLAKQNELKLAKRDLRNVEQAIPIVQLVAEQTQKELKYHISELVSLALSAVFDEPYTFQINFVSKRGKTEADITFVRDGIDFDPMSETGGGAVDVAAFALRVALWNLEKPKSASTLVLDEPGKFISQDLQPKFGAMIKLLADKMKIQFIVITHSNDLEENADKVFKVVKRKQISTVVG